MTISDNLISLQATKTKLKNNLFNCGVDSSAENTFDALVDLAFVDDMDSADDMWSPDAEWLAVKDLRTWTELGAISMIISDHGLAKVSFVVTTAGGQYNVIVNDGVSDISSTNYNSGAQCDIALTAGDGKKYYAIKITSASVIKQFAVARSPSVLQTTQTIPILWFYANIATLTSCANMFYATTTTCSLLQGVYVLDTRLVTNMSYMFFNCTSLRSVPAVLDTRLVTNMSYMFNGCTSLRSVPAVLDTSLVANMTAMFQNCYSLRSVPAVLDTRLVTNMSYMFFNCYSLRPVPAVLDTSLVTNMTAMFYDCYSLRSVPAVLDTSLVTNMADAFTTTRDLEITLFDLSKATALTKLKISEAQGIRGLIVSNIAPWSGVSPQIEIVNCGLDRTAIVVLFNSLGAVTGKSIKIAGCTGVPDLTAGDLSIATAKGWTVIMV